MYNNTPTYSVIAERLRALLLACLRQSAEQNAKPCLRHGQKRQRDDSFIFCVLRTCAHSVLLAARFASAGLAERSSMALAERTLLGMAEPSHAKQWQASSRDSAHCLARARAEARFWAWLGSAMPSSRDSARARHANCFAEPAEARRSQQHCLRGCGAKRQAILRQNRAPEQNREAQNRQKKRRSAHRTQNRRRAAARLCCWPSAGQANRALCRFWPCRRQGMARSGATAGHGALAERTLLLGSAFAQNREPSSMARSRRIATAGLAILREGGAKPYPESRALPEASAMWP